MGRHEGMGLKMARRKGKERSSRAAGGGRNPRALTWVLLLAAVAVGGVTIYVATAPPSRHPPPAPAPGPSEAEKTRRTLADLMARADKIGPDAPAELQARKRESYETVCRVAARYLQLEDRTDIVVRPILATAQVRLGRVDEAERTVDQLLKLAPNSAQGLWMKGQLVRRRDGKAALELFRRAADSDEAGGEIWSRFGLLLLSGGQDKEAEKYLTRAERAGWMDHDTRVALATLAIRADQFPRAERLLAEVARLPQATPQLLILLAEAQKNGGRLGEAEKTLRRALAARNAPTIHLQLGEVLLLAGRWPEAAAEFSRAAKAPGLEGASLKAARCYYVAGKYAQAMKQIDRAGELLGDSPAVQRWATKIENARFGEPKPEGPVFRIPSGAEAGTTTRPAGATTQPAGFFLK